mmetsp:Transcript_98569/g.260399  ORF Transcript_98569/g.260399 Transcript_98569/m.260399 type:complete len:593 (-) Transcript_98569:57-1835(-)
MSAEDAASEGPAASTVEEQLAAVKGVDIAATMSFMTDKFLRPADYTKIHQTLSKDWDRLQSLTAALKLMEKYGVAVSKEEEDRLASMDEERQIEALVLKMPQQSKDEFHQFFLQLQVLVATATKVRQALEQGRPDEVEGVLDATDPGIKPYVLRMAIVQAGSEADSASRQLRSWGKDRAAVMGRNIRGQEEAVNVNKKLQEARRQLNVFTSSQNDKSKKVVMNFLNNSAAGLKAASFKGWQSAMKTEKMEREVAGEFIDKIEKVKAKLLEIKSKNLENIRGSMGRKGKAMEAELLQDIFGIWQRETGESKLALQGEAQKAAVTAEMERAKAAQKAKARNAIARMSGNETVSLQTMVWSAWLTYLQDCAKEKALEADVRAKEAMIAEHIKAKGESAKKLLSATIGSTDSGLMHQMFQAWLEALREAKEEARVAEALQGAENKFKAFGAKGKTAGMSAAERVTYYNDMSLVIKTWSAWKLDTRMEKQLRFYHGKIEGKRRQLIGVQDMFRNFANELEGGLRKAGAESTRGDAPAVLKDRGLHKSASAVNLPDIHRKTHTSEKSQLSHTHNPQGRHPHKAMESRGGANAAYPSHH